MKLFLFFVLLDISILHATETLVYKKISGTKDLMTTYVCTPQKEEIVIEASNKDQTTKAVTTLSHQLKSFSCHYNHSKDYSLFTLDNGTLTAEGIIKGELRKEVHVIKDTLWIQEFEFGLLPFLQSSKNAWFFDILHPKNFKLHKMVARKQEITSLKLGDKSYEAKLVHVTLQGFKSMFWKAELWFDNTTHKLLLYKANEGPHTPNVTISLISSSAN
ncbi:MAG: hypothetical protein FJZ63_04250 [Chlamydiae bacterium]|nr:hypothetical protein [Chlamydiota bacterium]